jgi:hypothetical protein
MKKHQFSMLPVIAALLAFTFVSCDKDDDPVYALQGAWVGNYGNGSTPPATFFAANFKSGGNVTIEANNAASPSVAFGTWTQVGDSVKATYTYQIGSGTYSLAAKYTSSSNQMTGTWGSGTNAYNGGQISLTKQ